MSYLGNTLAKKKPGTMTGQNPQGWDWAAVSLQGNSNTALGDEVRCRGTHTSKTAVVSLQGNNNTTKTITHNSVTNLPSVTAVYPRTYGEQSKIIYLISNKKKPAILPELAGKAAM